MNKSKTTWAQLQKVTMQDQSMDTWYCLSLSFFQLVQFRWHKFIHEVADAAKLPLHSWRRSSPSLRLLLRSAKKALTTQRCRTIHRCLCISLVLPCIPVRMQSRLYTDRLANAWYAFGNCISIYIQYACLNHIRPKEILEGRPPISGLPSPETELYINHNSRHLHQGDNATSPWESGQLPRKYLSLFLLRSDYRKYLRWFSSTYSNMPTTWFMSWFI